MGVDATAIMILGLSVEELGLDLEKVTEADEWQDEQYHFNDLYFDVAFRSCYSGPEEDDTYIGFRIDSEDDINNYKEYKKRFKAAFGKKPKLQHFVHWW